VLALFASIVLIISEVPKGLNSVFAYTLFMGLVLASGYVSLLLSRARIKIELSEKGFSHIWIKRFLFSNEEDVELDWNQIIDYIYESDRNYDTFQLTLYSNLKYKIYRYNIFPQKDDFNQFISDFPKYITKINKEHDENIKPGKTFYEHPASKWILIFFTIVFMFLVINKISHNSANTNWVTLATLFFAIGFYWTQIMSRKKGK